MYLYIILPFITTLEKIADQCYNYAFPQPLMRTTQNENQPRFQAQAT